MEIEFRTGMEGVDASMVEGMFVGWPTPPSAERLVQVMAGSHRRVWALAGGRVVGYVAAISDGVLNASIPWLEVHPDWQGRGIGSELVRRLVAQLGDMYAIDLLCDADLLPWYESLGFTPVAGAAIRNRRALQATPETASPGGGAPATGSVPDAVLRPLCADDAEAVLDAFAASDDMARQGDVRDLAGARRYVERLLDADHRAFVVELDAGPVALVGMSLDPGNRSAWVFWWTHVAHRGRGLAGSAATAVANWALVEGGLERLELGHRVNNPASAAIARRAGFVVEGLERGKFLIGGERVDAVLAARLRSDPVPTGRVMPRSGDWRPCAVDHRP